VSATNCDTTPARSETAGLQKKIGGKISLPTFALRRCFVVSTQRTVAELLDALAAAMAERDLPWYLFGAQAAIVWGSPRLSADVDITAAIEPANVDSFIEAMRRHGFDLTFSDPDFLERTRVLLFVHRSTHMPLDVVLAGRGLEEDFLSRAIFVDVDGTHIPVISPEDLIIGKIMAGRPKDIEDIRSVIHLRRASLDGERIRRILTLLEQALGQSDLLPVFEKAWIEEGSQHETLRAKKAHRKSKRK
jgi:predicted nucleotidyltransferase